MASGRALVARTLRTVLRAVEGQVRPGPYFLSISGGWLPDGAPINWWQTGMDIIPSAARSAMVEACVSAYSQTVAMCPGDHWRLTGKGGRTRVKNSAASRILRKPNAYQSALDFMVNAVRQLYLEGNAYALALRNDRYEVSELHLMDATLSRPQVAGGEVFYRLAGNAVIAQQMPEALIVPQRDVLHIRLHADRSRQYPFPLWGQTPLLAALYDMGLAGAIAQQQQMFYMNQARPSAVINTDMPLDKDLVQELRDRWDEQTKGINQGKTPILTHGLKVNPWAQVPKDAQVAEVMKIAESHIALAFRVPMQILGLGGGTTFGSTEALMRFWIATGLGFALECCEQAFDRLFALKGEPDEYVEFNTDALLRSDFKDRIRGLKEAVTGGIMAPNEARNEEGYDDVREGDMPRMQQQMIPLDFAGKIPPAGPPAAHAPPPAGPPIPAAETKPPPPQPKPKADDVQRAAQRLRDNAAAINRRILG